LRRRCPSPTICWRPLMHACTDPPTESTDDARGPVLVLCSEGGRTATAS
jgi:hypothetical protein